jgi:mannose-6-phosphate isomerase-like protein (cupin superfamily)
MALVSAASAAQAQPAPPAPVPAASTAFATQAEIAEAIARAAATVKPGQASNNQPLRQVGSYSLNLEYRVAATPPSIHPDQIEMFQVIKGSGTLVTGGTIERNAQNVGTVVGGSAHHVAAGDTIIVPQNTPHWFNQIDGAMAALSIKMPAPPARP